MRGLGPLGAVGNAWTAVPGTVHEEMKYFQTEVFHDGGKPTYLKGSMDNQSLLAIVAFMSAGLIMGVSGVVNMMTMTGRRKE